MLSFAKGQESRDQAKLIAETVIVETKAIFQNFQTEINDRFREIQAQLRQLDTNLELLERKIVIKEMQDKQSMGQMHYKLHEVKNHKIQHEIEDIKRHLNLVQSFDEKGSA